MISDYLKFDEPVSIKELQKKTGYSNRRVRNLIEKERRIKKDFVIVSSSQSLGYYKTKDRQKILGYMAEQNRRAKKILYNLKGAKMFLEDENQLPLKEIKC